MRKLIIAIGIIAAILAILISFRSQGELHVMGRPLNLNTVASKILLEDRLHDLLEVISRSSFDSHNADQCLAME